MSTQPATPAASSAAVAEVSASRAARQRAREREGARPLGEKRALLHAQRQRADKVRFVARPAAGSDGALLLRTEDGAIAFVLRSAASGLTVERTQRRPLGACVWFNPCCSPATRPSHAGARPTPCGSTNRCCTTDCVAKAMFSSTANGEPPGLGALTLTEAFRARALFGIEEVSTAASMDEVLLRFQAVVGSLAGDSAVFMSFLRDDATLASYRSLVACDPLWSAEYARQQWFEDDPWLRHAMRYTARFSRGRGMRQSAAFPFTYSLAAKCRCRRTGAGLASILFRYGARALADVFGGATRRDGGR